MDFYGNYSKNIPKMLTSETTFSNYLLIVDAYSKIPKLYGMEIITTEEMMDKLDMFQDRFVKIAHFGWWDLERISADAGTKFTPMEFQGECRTRGVWLALAVPEHQEINGKVEVTWGTFCIIAHSLIVHAQFSEAYIHFSVNEHIRSYFPGTNNQRLDK